MKQMTAQEAIEILRDTPIDIRSTREDDIHTLYATALDMAIEALQRGLENVNADSCSEKPNESEPKTAESGSVDSEMPEIKSNRTTGGMIYLQDAIDALCAECTIDNPKTCSTIQEGDRWCDEVYILLNLPSAQPEKSTTEKKSQLAEEKSTCDLISRQAAIDAIQKWGLIDGLSEGQAIEILADEEKVPSAQPDLDEWCTDCSEYDHERHCCPRFNRVIREALKDAQPEVVHCRDCRYENTGECEYKFGLLVANDENFCSYGERRKEE